MISAYFAMCFASYCRALAIAVVYMQYGIEAAIGFMAIVGGF